MTEEFVGDDGIRSVDIVEEMETSYIDYAMSTIVARAIGVRDWDSEPMRSMFAALVEGG